MKKIILIIGILIGLSIGSSAQHNKEHIKYIVYQFEGGVTQESINILVDSLVINSIDSSHVCFISLFAWNDCNMIAKDVFEVIKISFLNDLVGKNIIVSLVRDHRPWMDEDFYMLHFTFTHLENVEHLTLHINEGHINNVKYWQEVLLTLSD
jgi:hypothetical protein